MGDYIKIDLDVATYEGKTWLARVHGRDPFAQGGLIREFCNTVERNTSRSGATGTYTYEIVPGVYESNEGRRRLGRRFWIVEAGSEPRQVDRDEALKYLEEVGL